MKREWYRIKLSMLSGTDQCIRFIDMVTSVYKNAGTTNTHNEPINNAIFLCCDAKLTPEELTVLKLSFAGDLIVVKHQGPGKAGWFDSFD